MSGERYKYDTKTIRQDLEARDIDGAKDEILDLVKKNVNGSTIYFDGWNALGTTAVLICVEKELRSMKDPPPELCFGRIIYIDCSTWKSKRVMQKRIAEELKLDRKTMDMFDKEDEEDDFNGVDAASRDVIRDVARVIDRILRESRFIMIFLNGSDEEVVPSRFGIPEYNDNIIIWTFRGTFPPRNLLSRYGSVQKLITKLRYTNIFLFGIGDGIHENRITRSDISALVREEAASILTRHPDMRDNDKEMVIDCYLYVLFLHHSFHEGTRWHWANHGANEGTSRLWANRGANYCICDGIIQGDRIREISKALYQEVSFDCNDACFASTSFFEARKIYPDSSHLVYGDHGDFSSTIIGKRPGRWISITSKNKIVGEKMNFSLANASSIILPFESTNSPYGLPNDLIKQCSNLRVLVLSYCAFNFLSPLFRHCHTLRFLGLDHCRNNHTAEREREEYTAKWACLHNLSVLDLRYTDWGRILSEENMDLMVNIMELSIKGFMCWQFTSQLEGRLPNLERLRIVKPLRPAEAAKDIDNSFRGMKKLEVLDLSGNNDIENLPTSLSKASNLQVLVLDGCDGLENIVLSNPLLRSFSFDGHGPASNWSSMVELPPESSRPKWDSSADKKDVKTYVISLVGCTQLENLFLRGLPNLEELDLSGCAIKILDLKVVDVPRLKRLFLLGCEHLRAIIWGTEQLELELLCIDTRPGRVPGCDRSSIAHSKSVKLQVHVITADARLVRSLFTLINGSSRNAICNIHITSSFVCGESSNDEISKTCHQQHNVVASASQYNDIFTDINADALTPMEGLFPQPPTSELDDYIHIEIGGGSCNVESEVEFVSYVRNLCNLMFHVVSLHVHDTSANTAVPPIFFFILQWCRVERCRRLDFVFPPRSACQSLETIWASRLLVARCIWSKGRRSSSSYFPCLRHLHLRSCPSLQFALPVWSSSFDSLETLYIIHCGSLRHVFELDKECTAAEHHPPA